MDEREVLFRDLTASKEVGHSPQLQDTQRRREERLLPLLLAQHCCFGTQGQWQHALDIARDSLQIQEKLPELADDAEPRIEAVDEGSERPTVSQYHHTLLLRSKLRLVLALSVAKALSHMVHLKNSLAHEVEDARMGELVQENICAFWADLFTSQHQQPRGDASNTEGDQPQRRLLFEVLVSMFPQTHVTGPAFKKVSSGIPTSIEQLAQLSDSGADPKLLLLEGGETEEASKTTAVTTTRRDNREEMVGTTNTVLAKAIAASAGSESIRMVRTSYIPDSDLLTRPTGLGFKVQGKDDGLELESRPLENVDRTHEESMLAQRRLTEVPVAMRNHLGESSFLIAPFPLGSQEASETLKAELLALSPELHPLALEAVQSGHPDGGYAVLGDVTDEQVKMLLDMKRTRYRALVAELVVHLGLASYRQSSSAGGISSSDISSEQLLHLVDILRRQVGQGTLSSELVVSTTRALAEKKTMKSPETSPASWFNALHFVSDALSQRWCPRHPAVMAAASKVLLESHPNAEHLKEALNYSQNEEDEEEELPVPRAMTDPRLAPLCAMVIALDSHNIRQEDQQPLGSEDGEDRQHATLLSSMLRAPGLLKFVIAS